MALNVEITGGGNIEQGARVSLTAVVTDADGNTPPGTLQYAWSASRGTFVGETDEETAVYHADFTDTGDVNVTITCNVTRAANANPTVSGPSLTALAEIGVTGILVNMFMTALGSVAPNSNSVLYNASTGTLAAGSDQRLATDIFVFQLRWDNTNNNFVLNNNEGGNLGNFFVGNDDQSVFIIFPDGTYEELPRSAFDAGTSHGNVWARWLVSDSSILTLLNGLSTTDDLVVGVADTGSIGWGADAGSDTETFTASVPLPLGIESINEQFITVGTEDYDLVIDITGNPDTVEAKGHMEGFIQDWDAVNGQLHIKSEEVTRLINGVNWDIEVVKDMQTLMGKIAYNVVSAAPIFETLGTIHLYRGVPINFDIVIQNIPPLLIPNARLLGLKSELVEYGINAKGRIGTTDNFTINTGNVSIIVPSETGGADTVYNYPYEIESGSPPAIGTPAFTPKGNFGELAVDDVTHALGYEWTLATGAAADVDWNAFSDSRPVINLSEVEVTPGNLQVEIKFPNIAGASSYEYMLESDSHEVDWTRFTGTLANGFITTIIPDLEEGVEYTLRLRVGAPWIGPPVSIKVYGGRICYTLQLDPGDRDNQWLYIFHTGYPNGAAINRTKRLLLPTVMTNPQGVCLDADGNVFIFNFFSSPQDAALYVFNKSHIDSLADGARMTVSRRNPFPSANFGQLQGALFRGAGIVNDQLYVNIGNVGGPFAGMLVLNPNLSDGAELSVIRKTNISQLSVGFSVDAQNLYYIKESGAQTKLAISDNNSGLVTTPASSEFTLRRGTTIITHLSIDGLKVIGRNVYILFQFGTENSIQLLNPRQGSSDYEEVWSAILPSGLTNDQFLDMVV